MTLRDYGVTGCTATGLDQNLAYLYEEMKAFAADRDLYLHMNALNKGLLGISSAADFPCGCLHCFASFRTFLVSNTVIDIFGHLRFLSCDEAMVQRSRYDIRPQVSRLQVRDSHGIP